MQNKFLNLTNLSIDSLHKSECTTHFKSIDLGSDPANMPWRELGRLVQVAIEEQFEILRVDEPVLAPQYFVYDIDTSAQMDEIDAEAVFESVVNAVVTLFFHKNVTPLAREREYRLDVPAQLIPHLHAAHDVIKSAVNRVCKFECFNIEISMGDLHYNLVGGVNNAN